MLGGREESRYRNGYLYEELLKSIFDNWRRNSVNRGAHLVVQKEAKREKSDATLLALLDVSAEA